MYKPYPAAPRTGPGTRTRGRSCRASLGIRKKLTLVAAASLALHGASDAAEWDPIPGVAGPGNGVVDGGPGLWDLFSPNWTTSGGASNGVWTNGDVAVFGGGTGGVVTIAGGGVSASALVFGPTLNLTPCTIQSQTAADVLTLLLPQVTANQNAVIAAPIAGSAGLEKLGAGVLTLGSAGNSFAGPVTVSGGTLAVSSDAHFGGAGNAITVQNGAILQALADVDLGAARVLSIGAGGGALDVAGSGTLTINDPGQLAGAGTLRKTGTGRLVLGAPGVGYAGTFFGNVAVGGGRLELHGDTAAGAGAISVEPGGTLAAVGAVVPNAVTLSGGTLSFGGASDA